LRFDGRVVIVTGAGNGLGKAYALEYARRGAKVVVNDLGGNRNGVGADASAAEQVVNEIRAFGGVAVPNYDSVEFGERIVQTALDHFGRIDVIVNNAGILRDRTFEKMTEDDWNLIMKVHVYGTYSVTKAAWSHMKKQKYGRIINTSSSSGIYGNFGQSNYGAAKSAVWGLANVLGKEGAKYNIHCNVIVPQSDSRLTSDVWGEELRNMLPADKVVPMVLWLTHESCPVNIQAFETGGGLFTRVRLQRSEGLYLAGKPTPEQVRDNWSKVDDYTQADYPGPTNEFIQNLSRSIQEHEAKPKL